MNELNYTVVVIPDEAGGFFTQVPALPGCGSQGETVDEALKNTKEAILAYLGSIYKHGGPAPEDNAVVVTVTVAA